MRGGCPCRVVTAQCFAVGVSDESSTIDDLGWTRNRWREVLDFGEEGKPAAEGFLVGGIVEAEEVGRAVRRGIGEGKDCLGGWILGGCILLG